jgi:hypothetical protein
LVAAVVALMVSACGAGASATYRESAVSALQGSLGEGRTVELAGRLWVTGRSTHSFTVVAVRDGEDGVGANTDWFEQQQPPTRSSDRIRQRTTDALAATDAAIQSVRISLDRNDVRATREALGSLRVACAQLESLSGELS